MTVSECCQPKFCQRAIIPRLKLSIALHIVPAFNIEESPMPDRRDIAFHELHASGLLLLANAWDAGSARIVAHAGAKAIATSSAAVAWAHGYVDGDKLPTRLLLATTSAIAEAVSIPLTVDIESGYSDDPGQVADVVGAVIDAGAVGINIEDGRGSPDLLCRKIEAARRVAQGRGVDLFINARTDVYLKRLVSAEQCVAETLVRAERYRAAGASGLFPAGVQNEDEIAAIVRGTPLPINVLALPGLPPADRLAALGVRRLSAGSGIAEAVNGAVHAIAQRFLQTGELVNAGHAPLSYGELNGMMARS
jgi:2-methylisocitrate lyase-like PEP mutase family enzyme